MPRASGKTFGRLLRRRGDDELPGWREAFGEELRVLFAKRLRIACAVLFALHGLGFVFLDTTGMEGLALWIRIAVLPITLLFAATTFVAPLRRRAPSLTVVFVVSLVVFVVWNNADMAKTLKTEALLLVLPASSLLFPFTTRAATVLAASTFVAFTAINALMTFGVMSVGFVEAAFYVACAGVLSSIGSAVAYRLREREFLQRLESERAHEQVEGLLLNTLPRSIVERLKEHEGAIADRYEEATVLFTDICGFTSFSSRVPPDDLVAFLNELFSKLDALCERHGLEKIKTIGDAYMVAGGLPEPRPDHAAAVARMALDMREAAAGMSTPHGEPLEMRIGIHSGPLVAGVIGRRKLNYDLWGDTVNTAARMESHAAPGTIQVTASTYERLKERFELERRGQVDVKGKGTMTTYLLVGERGATSDRARVDAPSPAAS